MPVVAASILVGLTWGGWHAMDFLMNNWTNGPGYWAGFAVYISGTSMVIGWLFMRSGGNIGIAILAHFGANIVNFFTPMWEDYDGSLLPAFLFIGSLWGTGLLLVLLDPRMRRAEKDFASERLESGEDLA